MSKKAKGRNAFFFFMLDFMDQEKARGRDFPQGLKDVQQDPKCSEQWKNLSKQEKGYYEAKAKGDKVLAQGTFIKKMTDGTPITVLDERERKKADFESNMLTYIKSLVDMGIRHNNLAELKFIFIHSCWFYSAIGEDNETDYCPAEFALCEFSIEEGIGDTYHEIIKATIPKGYTREALDTSQKYHQIPINFSEGESDFAAMFDRLMKFLEPHMTGRTCPPLYTVRRANGPARSLLNKLADATGSNPEMFRLYSLETLFLNLQNAVQSGNPNATHLRFTTVEYELDKDPFSYNRGLACKYHENTDVTREFCSLSVVKRWGFGIADYCCEELGIEMIPGIHKPKKLTDSDLDAINSRLHDMSIHRPAAQKLVSMTGVSQNYREKVSQETYDEEQRRRLFSEPIDVIDHSAIKESTNKIVTSTVPPECPRPLRAPKTMAKAMMPDDDVPNMGEMHFPPLGRGKAVKKVEDGHTLGLGRGSLNISRLARNWATAVSNN